ncbi:unnamed protein product [Lasius platythorax]|uniref:Uncharacterized protein n=1 Tax=Lasius platythorax TaxID=488582 RepID=A0AAV2MZH4_9HYME
MVNGGMSLPNAIQQFLFDYRTSHTTTQKTPASLMFNRELRNRFSLLRPPLTEYRVERQQKREVKNHKGLRIIKFTRGDTVAAKDYRGSKERWILAKIVKEITPGVTFEIQTMDGQIWKKHANQLAKQKDTQEVGTSSTTNRPILPGVEPLKKKLEPRRSERIRKKITAS